jgi:sulfite reductase beta subunit-like hemoprotein
MDADAPTSTAISLKSAELAAMSKNERIKSSSRGLFFVAGPKGEIHAFGSEIDALSRGETETLSGEAKEISKFFGIYKQQARGERGKKTDDYSFMVRIKAPAGGAFEPAQWIALDDAGEKFSDGTLRITSRQGVQFHHVMGRSPPRSCALNATTGTRPRWAPAAT